MSMEQPISGLETAERIPKGTTYVASMGDGSGTMAVSQELLTKEIGETLKVGDPKELQTEDKESIVAAINEVKNSGGGSVDILETPEEIEANTEAKKVAGALALKEMFSSLNDKLTLPDGTSIYIDMKDGVLGYNTDPERGADTFHPFSNQQKTFTVNLMGGYVQTTTTSYASSVQFNNVKIKVVVSSLSGSGSLVATVDGANTTLSAGKTYTFEGASIAINTKPPASNHTGFISAKLDIEWS